MHKRQNFEVVPPPGIFTPGELFGWEGEMGMPRCHFSNARAQSRGIPTGYGPNLDLLGEIPLWREGDLGSVGEEAASLELEGGQPVGTPPSSPTTQNHHTSAFTAQSPVERLPK